MSWKVGHMEEGLPKVKKLFTRLSKWLDAELSVFSCPSWGFPWGQHHFWVPTPPELSDWLHPQPLPEDQWDAQRLDPLLAHLVTCDKWHYMLNVLWLERFTHGTCMNSDFNQCKSCLLFVECHDFNWDHLSRLMWQILPQLFWRFFF